MTQPVVTRFAPSPTGALHIGGARTALFAWAFARQRGGRFILRIEDTDQTRSSDASTRGILDDMRWLGLTWDEGPEVGGDHGPYLQSQRLDLYARYTQQLLDAGLAYEQDGAVRFKVTEDIAFDDAVYGPIRVAANEVGDFVIRKSDGFPTYHFAVVVDDALMKVTHVIRGQEHLSNTPKHIALQHALGFAVPVYAHTPSILNPDGSKMSKRDKAKAARNAGATHGWPELPSIDAAQYQGFQNKDNDDIDIAQAIAAAMGLALPEINVADFHRSGYAVAPLLNYLALLGWSPKGEDERFTLDWFVERFNLGAINKGNAKFDREKLLAFNAEYLQQLRPEAFASTLRNHMAAFHAEKLAQLSDGFDTFAACYQARSRTLVDAVTQGAFFFASQVHHFDAKAVQKNLLKNDGEGLAVLRAFHDVLADCDDWSAPALQQRIETFTAEKGLKNMGSVAQPLRVALTGTAVSPPIDLTLALLGKTRTLERIQHCLETHKA